MLITRKKKENCDNLDTHEKELLKIMKKGKRNLRDNLDDEKREQVKESDKIRKKEMRNNLDDDKREQVRRSDKNRKKNECVQIKDERKQVFDNVHRYSMVDPFILTTPVFKIIEENFKSAIQEGLAYV